MNINLPKLKELAKAAQQNQYDPVALNDYGMAVPPATVLELIAEIERHRQVEAEGCKPEFSNRPADGHTADAMVMHSLDKAEGCKPDLINTPFFYALAGPDGKPVYQAMADACADQAVRQGVKNYAGATYTVTRDSGEQFEVVVTVQRSGAKSVQEINEELRAQLAELNPLLRDCLKAMLKGGYAKPLRERIKVALAATAELEGQP